MNPAGEVVAAFDVDGTLTTADTFLPFVRAVAGPLVFAAAAASLAPLAAAHVLGGGRRRDDLKAGIVRRTLAGRSVAELERVGHEHARRIERRWLRADTVARLRWHVREGHRVVFVSASLRPYLAPLAAAFGVEHVLCTDLAVADGVATGELDGGNCRGPAKRDRLLAWAGGQPRELWAYGDSAGDDELLAAAHHAVRVRKGRFIAAVPLEGVDR